MLYIYIYKVLGDLIDGQDYWRRLRFKSGWLPPQSLGYVQHATNHI